MVRLPSRLPERLVRGAIAPGENGMPHALDSGDRKLLIGAGVLAVVLIVVSAYLSPQQRSAASAYPSSYSGDWDGAKGPYLLLQNLHYHVERWEESQAELSG